MTILAHILALPVRFYRLFFSPWVWFNCRYQPTCSAYALEALEKHGAFKGSTLILRRLGRCHPFGGDCYDPVPGKHPPKSLPKIHTPRIFRPYLLRDWE